MNLYSRLRAMFGCHHEVQLEALERSMEELRRRMVSFEAVDPSRDRYRYTQFLIDFCRTNQMPTEFYESIVARIKNLQL